ncbi:hypothetical protein NQ156_13420 [Microbacterium sp. zg.Y625]|uniref:hypothetical protein n=1 Tax=Microbacterium jiangjiandongii TaxID=3049071 RepID=UPI00214AA30C|nr:MULTISPECIES: hypothetical protein [unclassified Microbacterium]MCR2794069.1 hypothetical protein [Microbacterium sp. zg.Y625]WIM25724.1 hypothetical protein QNO14_01345 [Microbacterium sp. zg-Y625]
MDALKYWLVCAALVLGAIVAARSHAMLPAKLFLDESIIRRFIAGTIRVDGPSSYGTTGWLYRVTGLADIPDLFPVLAYAVFAAGVVIAITWRGIPAMSFPELVVVAGSLLLGAVYLSQYSKEFFVLPLVIVLILARRSWVLEATWICLALLYAGFVRQYWFLVLVLYLALRVLIPRLRSAWLLVPVVMVGFAAMTLAFNLVLGAELTFFRTDINNALDIDRSTRIDDLIPGESLAAQWLNAVVMILAIAFPVTLVLSGDPLQMVTGLFVALCWVLVALRSARVVGRPGPGVIPLAFLLAFLMVQTVFEPDFGSYMRHITPQLPLFLALFVATDKRTGVRS